MNSKTQKLEIYTDGSSLGNPGRGGYGVVFTQDQRIIHEISGGELHTTNNRMELRACIEALRYIIHRTDLWVENTEVVIHADSAYVLGGITSWVYGWEKNGWRKADKKEVLNQDLWQELLAFVRECKYKLSWVKVKGHSGVEYNERADVLATTYANNQKGN